MSNPFRHVQADDPLRFPAPVYNALIDMWDWWQQQQADQRAGFQRHRDQTGLVRVYNGSGTDLDTGQILAISAHSYTHDDDPAEFLYHPMLDGDTPTAASFANWAILREPIADQEIGWAVVSGLAAAKVYIYDTGHEWADVHPYPSGSEAYYLASGQAGNARIVTQDSGTGLTWCLVDLFGPELIRRFELVDALAPGGTATARPLDAAGAIVTDTDREFEVEDVLGIWRGRKNGLYTSTNDRGSQGYARRLLDRSSNWEILQMQQTAYEVKGLAYGAVSGSGAFLIDNLKIMKPVGGLITNETAANYNAGRLSVENTFEDDVDDNGIVIATWNDEEDQWEGPHSECPA